MGTIDSGNTRMDPDIRVLGFLMTPGVAFYYGGMGSCQGRPEHADARDGRAVGHHDYLDPVGIGRLPRRFRHQRHLRRSGQRLPAEGLHVARDGVFTPPV